MAQQSSQITGIAFDKPDGHIRLTAHFEDGQSVEIIGLEAEEYLSQLADSAQTAVRAAIQKSQDP